MVSRELQEARQSLSPFQYDLLLENMQLEGITEEILEQNPEFASRYIENFPTRPQVVPAPPSQQQRSPQLNARPPPLRTHVSRRPSVPPSLQEKSPELYKQVIGELKGKIPPNHQSNERQALPTQGHENAQPGRPETSAVPTFPNSLIGVWTSSMNKKPPRVEEKDILIAVMGMTGAGKTSFIKAITGADIEVGHGLNSCTKEIQVAITRIDNHVVHFIDTPGFDDTDLKDSDILSIIAVFLEGYHSKGVRLSGILYLHDIANSRIGGTAIRNLGLFRKLVGDDKMANVILLTTKWNLLQTVQDGETRLADLIGVDGRWDIMIASGARHERYHGTRGDALRIVRPMLPNPRMVLKIQEELAQGTKLHDTEAGKEVNERVEKLLREHAEEIAEMRKEMEEALKAENRQLYKKLQSRREKMLRKTAEAKRRSRMQQEENEILRDRLAKLEAGSFCVVC